MCIRDRFGGEHRGEVEGRRAVRTADDTDGTGLGGREAQGVSAEERREDADRRVGAEQEALRVGDQRAEIGHRPHADEEMCIRDSFEGLLNVKSSYLLCGNPMQQTENKRINANKSISGR